MKDSSQPAVKSAMRTLDIIELVAARPHGIIAQDIAQALAIPVSSLSYLLSTLVERDYLMREGRRYYPGPGLDRLRVDRPRLSLADRARPLIRSIRAQMNETVSLFVVAGWELEAIVTETADQTLRYSINVGERTPMHCVAAGKAVLAALDDAALDRYFVESSRHAFSKATITQEDALRQEIERVRQAGYAVTQDEYTPGVSGVGVAILEEGEVSGALGLVMPSVRFDAGKRDRAVTLLHDAAGQLGGASG